MPTPGSALLVHSRRRQNTFEVQRHLTSRRGSADHAMAVSSTMRRAYSLALCRVGECAPPLRTGSVRTQGIEIVVGDDATLAWESSFSCSAISM